MSKRVFRYLFMLTASVLAMTVGFMFIVLAFRIPTHMTNELEQLRVAIVQEDGNVPFDNWVDPQILPELRTRPEVEEAFRTGVATAKRYSPTLKEELYYVAIKITSKDVIKLAFTTDDIVSLMISFAKDFAACLLLAVLITLLIAKILTARLIAPFNNVDHPEDVMKTYPEIGPYVKKINDLEESLTRTTKYRTEFSANVSHELNTPVTQIISATQALKIGINSKRMNKDEVNEYIDDIIDSSKNLSVLIKQILELSKFDEATANMKRSDIDLIESTNLVIEKLKKVHRSCSESVNVVALLPVRISVDRTLWEIVSKNLIENAMKYSKPETQIKVEITNDYFAVTNYGEIMSDEQIDHIFERFYRTENAQKESLEEKHSGYGLGLAFVQNIVQAHGFSINVTSTEINGNCFKVIFNKN